MPGQKQTQHREKALLLCRRQVAPVNDLLTVTNSLFTSCTRPRSERLEQDQINQIMIQRTLIEGNRAGFVARGETNDFYSVIG